MTQQTQNTKPDGSTNQSMMDSHGWYNHCYPTKEASDAGSKELGEAILANLKRNLAKEEEEYAAWDKEAQALGYKGWQEQTTAESNALRAKASAGK